MPLEKCLYTMSRMEMKRNEIYKYNAKDILISLRLDETIKVLFEKVKYLEEVKKKK